MATRNLKIVDKNSLRRLAHIIGPSSAAAKALADFDKRVADGEDVTIYSENQTLLVGPTPPAQ